MTRPIILFKTHRTPRSSEGVYFNESFTFVEAFPLLMSASVPGLHYHLNNASNRKNVEFPFRAFLKFPFFLSLLLRPRTGRRFCDLLSTYNFRSILRTSRQAICPSLWTRARCLWTSSVNTCPTTPRSGRSPGSGSDLVSAPHKGCWARGARGTERGRKRGSGSRIDWLKMN